MLTNTADLPDCRKIFIKNFLLSMRIGIYPHEQERFQKVLINIECWVPLAASTPKNDSIDEVVNYDYIRSGITNLTEKNHFNLQETLCDAIVTMCFAHASVVAARVTTEKLEAYADCDSAGIEVFRIKEKIK